MTPERREDLGVWFNGRELLWEIRQLKEALAVLGRQLAETEAYAKEGWDWLDEALEALGAKTVFDIEARKRQLAEKDEALRAIIAKSEQSAHLPAHDRNLIESIARSGLSV